MHQSRLQHTMGAFAILLGMIACALPAQTIQPTPGIDPNAIETSIAGTLQAAPQLTEQAGLMVPTGTPVPVQEPTPSPVISSYGTSLTVREDGSKQYIDHRAGVQIIFPTNWLAMRVGEPEYYEAWEREAAGNPHLLDAITSIQTLDLDHFRVTAYDMHSEHILYGNLPKINIVFVQDDPRTLKQVERDERRANSPLAQQKFLPSVFQETPDGLQIVVIQYQWKSSHANMSYKSLYKGVLFKVPNGTVAIDLFIPSELKEALQPEFDQIVGSLSLFTP